MSNPTSLTIHEVNQLLDSKKISSEELTRAYLDRIKEKDGAVQSYINVYPDLAIDEAKKADAEFAKSGKRKVLQGIPLGPKDIYLTRGMKTTCASKILENYVPPYNSTVIDKCLDVGAVLLGKVNLDEFAMGSSTENSAFMKTKNPWDLSRVPGGSSGGSAAAVAADLCAASLGTDTGGSIRQPAAFCGIVGIKPTYGRVSRYGVIAFASSLDQMGPMTKDVEDAAILMNVMAGHDEKDSTSVNVAVPDYTKFLNQSVKGLKVGVPKEYFIPGTDGEVSDAVKKAIKQLESLGAIVEEVSLPNTDIAAAVYYILAPAEASSNLARYDGVRFGFRGSDLSLSDLYEQTKTIGFGREVKRRIMLGTYVLSAGYYDAYYIKAQRARTLIRRDFEEALKKVDVLVTPVTPTTAFKIGEKTDDPIQMYLSDLFTIPLNLGGMPGLSVPCGFDSKGLPIGFQMIGKSFDEGTLIKLAHAYEQSTDWHKKKPKL